MTKWEYKAWEHRGEPETVLIEFLNDIGSKGWDVFFVSYSKDVFDNFYNKIIAKRCISPNETTNSSSPTTPESC